MRRCAAIHQQHAFGSIEHRDVAAVSREQPETFGEADFSGRSLTCRDPRGTQRQRGAGCGLEE